MRCASTACVLPAPSDARFAGVWYEEPASENMLRAPYTEPVAPSTTSRVDLEIGSQVKIPVFIFKATTEAKVPSMKMYNEAAVEAGNSPFVKREADYWCPDKLEVSLGPEQVISGACDLKACIA